MDPTATFTFICLAKNQVASFVEVLELPVDRFRQRALQLMQEHASCATVEVWRDDAVWAVVDRDGVQPPHAGEGVSLPGAGAIS